MSDTYKENISETKEENPVMIQYFVHEGIVARQERHIKRLWILCLVIFSALILTNAGWIWYESQFEDVVMTQEATTDGGGDAIVSGTATGDINNYGESEADSESPAP